MKTLPERVTPKLIPKIPEQETVSDGEYLGSKNTDSDSWYSLEEQELTEEQYQEEIQKVEEEE